MFGRKTNTLTASAAAFSTPTESERSTTLLPCLVLVAQTHGVLLTTRQLIQDNMFSSDDITVHQLLVCARRAGFRAKVVKLRSEDLGSLRKALPAIVCLRSGGAMVLTEFDADPAAPTVGLTDPGEGEDIALTLDPVRLAEAWTGEVILVKREYDLANQEDSFSFGMIAKLVCREQRLIRNMTISSFFVSLFALVPIAFLFIVSDYVIYYAALNTFTVLLLGVLVIIVFEALFIYAREFALHVITSRVDARLNEYMFDNLLRLPIDFFERTQIGEIAHDMNEIYRIRNFMTGQMFRAALDSMMLVFFLPPMFIFSPLLSAIVLATCGLIVCWLLAMLPKLRDAVSRMIKAESERGSFLYQTVAGIRTVKSLALEPRHRREWDRMTANVARRGEEVGHISGVMQTGVRPLSRLAVAGSFAIGVYIAIANHGDVSIGGLFAFMLLSQRVAGPLMQIAELVHTYDEARAAVALVGGLVNRPKEEDLIAHGVRKPLDGHVEFVNLSFKYAGATSYALENVSFEVPIGSTLGVVGRSGSGKTTVTRLLQRLHSDYTGLIKIDGVDVREYDIRHLRRSLGVVLQENFLFSGTIRENVCSAKAHATFDEVVNACRLAGAEEFIERLPQGYNTFIYEGSPNLSGGQRQRLAIARALILDPRILILDEAASALDPDSEAIVNDNIRRIASGRTVIVISHRLSSLVNSDAILVLERGKFADLGKHAELLTRCEIYRVLWNQQNRHSTAAARVSSQRGPSRVS